MTSKATTPQQYLDELPADRKEAVTKLRNTVVKNLPQGFKETMAYGMLGYVIPHELYPPGYHCDPKLPLGLAGIACQKNIKSGKMKPPTNFLSHFQRLFNGQNGYIKRVMKK